MKAANSKAGNLNLMLKILSSKSVEDKCTFIQSHWQGPIDSMATETYCLTQPSVLLWSCSLKIL